MRVAIVCLVMLVPLCSGAIVESSPRVTVTGLAVAETSEGLVGTTARVEALALQGSGGVFVDTRPLSQTDMQASARLAARVAADTLGLDWREYDVLLTFRSSSPVIGGPSAGAVMSLAVAAAFWALENPDDPWTVDSRVAATGTINPDGTIGPVGGVPAKAQGAARAGIHTVLYPAGQEVAARVDGTAVDMDDHCRSLDVRCIPAASLTDLIRVAADRVIERPEPTVPGTADFPQLEETVQEQVDSLATRLDASRQRAAGFDGPAAVEEALADAEARLAEARSDLEQGDYYLGATRSFRGLIQQRYADALMDLHAQEPERDVVGSHIEDCTQALARLQVAATADDWTALSAIGAAQVRVGLAQDLLVQAQARLASAATLADWHAALLEASFCQERADTVEWWQSLPALFPPGAPVEDAQQRSQDALGRAADMVAYALSVQGTAGRAPQLLEQARTHHEAGRYPAAMLDAVQAEAAASVSLQAADGSVSEAVLDEALLAASRAVARARSEGNEPVLAVSLIELAQTEPPADALLDLWTARGVALLGSSATAPAPEVTGIASGPAYPPLPVALGLAVLAGIVMGAGAGAVVWAASRRQP